MSDMKMVVRVLKVKFLEATLSGAQKAAYDELVQQVDHAVMQRDCSKQNIRVPATIKRKDADKALKLIKLQYDSSWDFQVTYEGQPKNTRLITEKKNKPQI